MASAIDATKPVAGSPTTQSVRDNFASAASEITALQSAITYSFQTPLTGATLSASTGLGAFVINPAGPIAALNVVLPPGPTDGQIFELSTDQTITAMAVTAPAGALVQQGSGMLTAGGGMSWRYHPPDTTWYRRF